MRRGILLVMLGVAAAEVATAQPAKPAAQTSEALIEQLGHPAYAERRDARRRLLSTGLAAFDALRAGREHEDPEVAEACASLLGELTLDWAWLGDPTRVRLLLNEYDRLTIDGRLEIVGELVDLPDQQGVPALVRLARFEPSELVAARAAAALLTSETYHPEEGRLEAIEEASAELDAAFGPSGRPPANWLELAYDEADASAWREAARREAKRMRSGREETSLGVVATLDWCWLGASLRGDDEANALAAIEALAGIDPDQRAVRLRRVLKWTVEADRLRIGQQIAEAYEPDLLNKRGLYARADLAAAAGETEHAADLASAALQTPATERVGTREATLFGPRAMVAEELVEAGRDAWAEAEYTAASEALEPLDGAAVYARWKLANQLFDRELYDRAAETLDPLIELLDRSEEARKDYASLPLVKSGYLPSHYRMNSRLDSTLVARTRLATALGARARGDRDAEVAALREAIAADPSDADIVIAMHRVSDPPEGFAEDTRQHAARLRREYEKQIWENADSPKREVSSQPFNHWAWLVGNTEGDFAKAVRYSERSLEIRPDTAGYLDTLGRCLFSAGRIPEAIAAQRRAVELEPSMKVMQRQLAEFERAQAEQDPNPAEVD